MTLRQAYFRFVECALVVGKAASAAQRLPRVVKQERHRSHGVAARRYGCHVVRSAQQPEIVHPLQSVEKRTDHQPVEILDGPDLLVDAAGVSGLIRRLDMYPYEIVAVQRGDSVFS